MIALALMLLVTSSPLELAFDHYEAGRYEQAFDVFEAHAEDGVSGALLYNLGNCAYRLDRLPEAVLYYRRALLRRPSDEEIRFNLRLTERRLGLETSEATWLERVDARVGELPGGLLLAAALGLQSLGLVGWLLLRGRPLGRLSSLALLLVGLAAGVRSVDAALLSELRQGVALETAIVRAEPHTDLPARWELLPGETLRVVEESDRWLRIERAGETGWVERPKVGLVE